MLISDLGDIDRIALENTAAEWGLEADSLIIRKGIGDDDLCDLINMSRTLVFPSRYEGFGLPVLEAMQCGTPVVVAANSSLLEGAHGPARYVACDDAHRCEPASFLRQ